MPASEGYVVFNITSFNEQLLRLPGIVLIYQKRAIFTVIALALINGIMNTWLQISSICGSIFS